MVHQREIGGGRICVEVPGDPVCWIFSKTNPCPLANTRSDSIGGVGANGVNGKVHDVVASGLESISLSQRLAQERKSSVSGVLYLVEVHFMLKLITGDPTIVPMRRHMFGEMGRTLLGCKLLEEEGVIASLLAEASLFSDVIKTGEDDVSFTHIDIPHSGSAESLLLFDEPAECETTEVDRPVTLATEQATVHRIKAAVWALGHLGSTDNGFEALLRQDPNFVAWCVDMVQSSSYFSLRSVCFSALGLLSRSDKSKEVFAQLGWDCSTNHCSAVAIPNDLSRMFKSQASETQDNLNMSPVLASDGTTPIKGAHRVNREHLYNLISEVVDPEKRELYCDVLECIAKLPGHILYKDIKSRLAKMQLVHPDLFADRALYLATHQVLLLFSFNLTIRRHIFSLFHSDARLSV